MSEVFISSLSPVDVAFFVALMIIPSAIGVYFAYVDKGSMSTKNYYFGGRRMNPVAVGISSAVTSISAVTMIGYPAEVYMIGTVFFWVPFVVCFAAFITIIYYLPTYCRLKLDTIYEYLELRFNTTTKRIVAVMVPAGDIFYMGVTIYTPALALNAVTPIPLAWSIAGTSIICTFYTTLGGMKAVIWTDVVQAVLMISSLVAVFICGIVSIGGFGALSQSLERGGRLTFFNTQKFDISSRMSIPAITFGEFFVYTHYLSLSQPIFQRIQSCKTQRQSTQSLIAYVLTAVIIVCFSIGNGLTLYAYFEGCDPVVSGKVQRLDQASPLMALQVFRDLPGMSGVFIAAVFSGTLR